MTDQVTKVFLNHELESLCCTGGVTGDHGAAGHNMADGGRVRIKTLCGDSVCQVLGSEYAAETFVVVDDEDTVGALGST